MTRNEYRKAIAIVGLSQLGAARFFKAGPRTGQRWAAKSPPNGIALCLRLMLALKLSANDVMKLLGADRVSS